MSSNERMDSQSRQLTVDSPEAMVGAIRHFGIIPFFKGGIPGWSIEELTPKEWWFFTSDNLGPWDWKIDAVREGDIAYGKFLGGKAAFATADLYRHLMNWRRSLPKYQAAVRGKASKAAGSKAVASTGSKAAKDSTSEKLMRYLSPLALEAIKEAGAAESRELRHICSEGLTPYQIKSLGAKYRPLLTPALKKSIMDSVLQYLDMGTWTVVGDFSRVYRGANLEYSGWQRSSITTPDALFGHTSPAPSDSAPSWARIMEGAFGGFDAECDSGSARATAYASDGSCASSSARTQANAPILPDCSPEESRDYLIAHLTHLLPGWEEEIGKII